MVQLSHLHMTTGKAIALTRWTFVGKGFDILQQFGKILSDGVSEYCLILTLFPHSGSLMHTHIHTHLFIYVNTYISVYMHISYTNIYNNFSFFVPATLAFFPISLFLLWLHFG